MSTTDQDPPLQGLRVVEFGQFIAGPGTAMLLGDLGADVIKVESLDGDEARNVNSRPRGTAMVLGFNRNKRSISVNMKAPAGLAIVEQLVATADIVVHNLRPSVAEQFGLDGPTLTDRHPALVHVAISGFGTSGTAKHRRGFDIAAQAESGMMSINGTPDGPPLKVGFTIVDLAATYVAANAVLAALVRRGRTGRGERIDVSLIDVAVGMQANLWADFLFTGREPGRHGNMQPAVAPAADVIDTKDGAVVLSAYTQKHFAALCDVIGRPELPHDERFATVEARVANRPAMLKELAVAISAQTTADLAETLESAGIVVGAVLTYSQVLERLEEQGDRLLQIEDHEGVSMQTVGSAHRMAGWSPTTASSPPRLGEHTAVVLAELGLDDHQVQELHDAAVVRIAAAPAHADDEYSHSHG